MGLSDLDQNWAKTRRLDNSIVQYMWSLRRLKRSTLRTKCIYWTESHKLSNWTIILVRLFPKFSGKKLIEYKLPCRAREQLNRKHRWNSKGVCVIFCVVQILEDKREISHFWETSRGSGLHSIWHISGLRPACRENLKWIEILSNIKWIEIKSNRSIERLVQACRVKLVRVERWARWSLVLMLMICQIQGQKKMVVTINNKQTNRFAE